MRHALAIAFPLLAACIALVLGLLPRLGAHPQWAAEALLIGAPAGILIGYVLRLIQLPYLLRLAITFGAFAMATYLAHEGRLAFGASFAEDTQAGQLWHFGWIGACTMGAAILTTIPLIKRG